MATLNITGQMFPLPRISSPGTIAGSGLTPRIVAYLMFPLPLVHGPLLPITNARPEIWPSGLFNAGGGGASGTVGYGT